MFEMPQEPRPRSPAEARRLSAIWFADIVGYTRLSTENQVRALWLVRLLQSTADLVVGGSEGRVVKRLGDAVLAEFSSTLSAVRAAIALQQAFQDQTKHSGAPATLRIGIHVGDMVVDADGDIYGDGVNLASRLQACASSGMVVTSEDVWRQLRGRPEFDFQPLGEKALKGSELRMAVYTVIHVTADDQTAVAVGDAPSVVVPRQREAVETAGCPYVGLRSFSETDAPVYFGREWFSRQLFEKLHQHCLVALVASSGSGKSSLVQAGLLPLLRRRITPEERWYAVVFTPGSRPFHSLAASLVELWSAGRSAADRLREAEQLGNDCATEQIPVASAVLAALDQLDHRGVGRLLIIVDQFEELFTQTSDDATRRAFIEQLLSAVEDSPVRIILTLRADFYGQAIEASRPLSDLIQAGIVNVGPMSTDELARAIVEPAAVAGLQFERGLVERILDDMREQPGALPLLQFALTELWDRRQGRLLTHGGYESIGKVDGAIGRRADRELGTLRPDEQERLLRELTRLVHVAAPEDEGTDTRVRARLTELSAEAREPVRTFVRARLLVADRDVVSAEETVEVAHEALIRSWPRFRERLDNYRGFLVWRQRLRQRVEDWEELGRPGDLLLRGALLGEARRWGRAHSEYLNGRESDFITRSTVAEGGRRRRIVAATIGGGLIVSAAMGMWAYSFTDHYQLKRTLADGQRIVGAAEDSTANDWYDALVGAGFVEEALRSARAVPVIHRRSLALSHIAATLEQSGDVARAQLILREGASLAASAAEEARGISDPEIRAQELAEIVAALFTARATDEAAAVAVEAVASAQQLSQQRRSEVVIGIIPVIIRGGQAPFALSVLRELDVDDGTLSVLVPASLMEAGEVDEAMTFIARADSAERSFAMEFALMGLWNVAHSRLDSDEARKVLAEATAAGAPLPFVLAALLEAGALTEVLQAMEAARDSVGNYPSDFANLIPVLAEAGLLEQAREILGTSPEDEQPLYIARIALESVRYGAPDRAVPLIPEVIRAAERSRDPGRSSFLFAHLIETYELLGQKADAVAIAARGDSAALLIRNETSRSNTTREIAKRYATLGLLRKAREVANRRFIADNDRLEIYTTIVEQYTRERSPEFRARAS